jgi:hypothetical protein
VKLVIITLFIGVNKGIMKPVCVLIVSETIIWSNKETSPFSKENSAVNRSPRLVEATI